MSDNSFRGNEKIVLKVKNHFLAHPKQIIRHEQDRCGYR